LRPNHSSPLKPDLLIGSGPQIAVRPETRQPLPFRLYSWVWPIPSGSASSKAYRDQVANITGLATLVPEDFLGENGYQLLQDLVAGASKKFALLVNPGNQMNRLIVTEYVPGTARKLGRDAC